MKNFSFKKLQQIKSLLILSSLLQNVCFSIILLIFVNTYSAFAQTAIGGNTPDPSTMLDVQSTAKGVLFPRMTASQRNAIVSPATGLMIFNTDITSLEINLGTPASPSWQVIIRGPGTVATLDCNNFRFVGANLRSTVAASGNSVRVPYTGGNGWIHDGQTVASTGVTGLTATLAAGSFATGADSLTYTITGTPSADGLAAFALNIGGQSCTLNIIVGCGAYVSSGVWKGFSCYNLGAANTGGDPFTPSWEINGGYWQWGIAAEAAPGPTGTGGNTPNDGAPGTWNTTAAANGSWTDTDPMPNNPCPMGYRVPTTSQWSGVTNSTLNPPTLIGTWTDGPTEYGSGRKFGNYLFLPAAGGRIDNNGSLFGRGSLGTYWSSSESGSSTNSWRMYFTNSSASLISSLRIIGTSVRCIAE